MEFFLATFGLLGRVRFTVQNYCGREKCQAPPWAFGEGLTEAFRKFSRPSKLQENFTPTSLKNLQDFRLQQFLARFES